MRKKSKFYCKKIISQKCIERIHQSLYIEFQAFELDEKHIYFSSQSLLYFFSQKNDLETETNIDIL